MKSITVEEGKEIKEESEDCGKFSEEEFLHEYDYTKKRFEKIYNEKNSQGI